MQLKDKIKLYKKLAKITNDEERYKRLADLDAELWEEQYGKTKYRCKTNLPAWLKY